MMKISESDVARQSRIQLGFKKCNAIIDALKEFPSASIEDVVQATCEIPMLNFYQEASLKDIAYISERIFPCTMCNDWVDKSKRPISSVCEHCSASIKERREQILVDDGINYLKNLPDHIRDKIISSFAGR